MNNSACKRICLFCLPATLAIAAAALWLLTFDPNSHDTRQPEPRPAAADPRLSYAGPYLNVHPGVKYVGSDVCGNCHVEIAEVFADHPMGKSLLPIAAVAARLPHDTKSHNPFRAKDSLFSVVRDAGKVKHRQARLDAGGEAIFTHDTEAHFAIGSGNHGHSFLSQRDGYLFQTAISWFSQKGIWDLSPGENISTAGRPILPMCLFCHSNRARAEDGYINRYQSPIFVDGHAIGCERCHGPGEKHVVQPGIFEHKTAIDPTIVNPAKLPSALREGVCHQCHLTGLARVLPRGRHLYDFRPGMPIESFWSIFVHEQKTGQDKKAVNHVEQTYQSRCFRDSPADRKLGCISCHDPHRRVEPSAKAEFFRNRCLKCHADADRAGHGGTGSACSLPRNKRLENGNSCHACHMPRYSSSDIAHAAMTDHRIVRKAEAKNGGKANVPTDPHGPTAVLTADARLAHFHLGFSDEKNKDMVRDLGLAYVRTVLEGKGVPQHLSRAIDLLEEACANDPLDWPAWEEKGKALYFLGRKSEALAAIETALAANVRSESLLYTAAMTYQDLRQHEPAIRHWLRLIDLNPWNARYRISLAQLLAGQKDWPRALEHAQTGVRLEPESVEVRKLLVACLARTGRVSEASTEFDVLLRLQPEQRHALTTWWTALAKPGAR